MFNYFQEQLEKSRKKLTPYVINHLTAMLKPTWSSDRWGDGEYDSGLAFQCRKIGGLARSTFELPHDMFARSKEFLSTLSKRARENIVGIGRLMRKYMNVDLEHIKEKYSW
jgi:hypothetical protein